MYVNHLRLSAGKLKLLLTYLLTYLHRLPIPASSAPYRASSTFIRCQHASGESACATIMNRLQVRSSGLHVLAHCTMRFLPIYLMEIVLYPCHTFPGGVCSVHLFTEILLCRGQIVFGWVLETSRVLGPHSGTFFQLT
jgi:hypothetical protein